MTCAARSTTVLVNFMVAWSILAAMRGERRDLCLSTLAMAIDISNYLMCLGYCAGEIRYDHTPSYQSTLASGGAAFCTSCHMTHL